MDACTTRWVTRVKVFSLWEAGPRSAAELKQAATHFDRAAALNPAPAAKAKLAGKAALCRRQADTV